MAPTRFPSGVTNVTPTADTYQFVMPDPSTVSLYWDDFHVFRTGDWTITALDGGADSGEVTAVADADGGILTVTTNDADNDNVCIESQGESFTLETGKKAWIKARFKIEDADDSDFYLGLHETDTNPFSTAPAHRAYFTLTEGSAALTFNVDDGTTDDSSSTVATLADDTYITVAAYYDGKTTIELFANGAKATSMTDVSLPANAMAFGFGVATGAAATRTLSVDYVLVAKAR